VLSSPNKKVWLETWKGSYKMTEPTEAAQQILFGGSLNILCGKPLSPFGCADKPAEKHCWLICCERKTLFRLKK
jgi:hypothetical protein